MIDSMKFFTQISIHAPREGGDPVPTTIKLRDTVISIHAPREGGDCMRIDIYI